MSKTLKWILIILGIVIVLLVVAKAGGLFGKDEGTPVTAEKAMKRTLTETVNASGKIFPEIEVKVSSDISGEIVELDVKEGDTVRKGQVLAKVYADIYASQRDQAAAGVAQSEAQESNSVAQLQALKATLDQTEAQYNREKTLLDQKVVSRQEYEQSQQAYLSAKASYAAAQQGIKASEAAIKSAQANLNLATKTESRTTIVASMDGVISLLEVKKGERVVGVAQMAGTEIMRIADLSSIETQVDVGENDIPKVKLGDSAVIEVDAFNNRKFKGYVYKIANPVTTASTTGSTSSSTTVTNYQVHIRLLPSSYSDLIVKNQPFPFRPDMTASADIQTKTHKDKLTVPLNAVTTRDKNSDATAKKKDDTNTTGQPEQQASVTSDDDIQEVVFVLQPDGTVKKFPVKSDIQDINYIEITSGINDSATVITGPYDIVSKTLKDKQKVKVVTKDDLLKTNK